MSKTEDLIRTYEARLAEIEARLARVEAGGTAPAPRRPARAGGLRLGVDVGGTFTDLILLDAAAGKVWSAKVPSTPEDSSIGVLNGIEKICREAAIRPSDIGEVMHGTT
ncbi:MAG: hydantoinase/oxoprolinase N-terminal domain-containing protein, partial [Gemmobacter sp.]